MVGLSREGRELARRLGIAACMSVPKTALGAVVEAGHPCDDAFAFDIAQRCAAQNIPHLQLVRAPWRAGGPDKWARLRRAEDAVRLIAPQARVLVTTGRQDARALRGLRATLLFRRLGPAPCGAQARRSWLTGEGPFSVAEELALMRKHRVDWVLARNAGGSGGWPKLAAARRLGLRVALVDRPKRPAGPRVTTVEEAMVWLSKLAG